jgi:hypothetical protein
MQKHLSHHMGWYCNRIFSEKYFMRLSLSLLFSTVFLMCITNAQTGDILNRPPDTSFKPPIEKPAYPTGHGSVVMIDEAHLNVHTATGRYLPFAELLRRDGYVVQASKSPFTTASLKRGKILVIANALNERNQTDWSPPNPSAFTDGEIAAVRDWVKGGGSLLLIADHLPWPGAADKLASAFGVHFNNGYAFDEKTQNGNFVFKRTDGSLTGHPITRGRAANERIDSVAAFTGSAFQIDKGGEPLLILGPSVVSYMPSVFGGHRNPGTPHIPVKGWYQGAVMRFGKGRVAVFGEAAMFTAQLAGPDRRPFGMNAPIARQNAQFVLNVLHWLSGLLDK